MDSIVEGDLAALGKFLMLLMSLKKKGENQTDDRQWIIAFLMFVLKIQKLILAQKACRIIDSHYFPSHKMIDVGHHVPQPIQDVGD